LPQPRTRGRDLPEFFRSLSQYPEAKPRNVTGRERSPPRLFFILTTTLVLVGWARRYLAAWVALGIRIGPEVWEGRPAGHSHLALRGSPQILADTLAATPQDVYLGDETAERA
jgi:hypothetical protein